MRGARRALVQRFGAAGSAWAVAWSLCAAGCGGGGARTATITAAAPGGDDVRTTLGRRCAELVGARRAEVERHQYEPPEVLRHPRPGDAGATPGGTQRIAEADLHDLLRDPARRVSVIIARGGSGKSKLAWSIEASVCTKQPTVRVDLQWDVADVQPLGGDQNPLLRATAARLGAPADVVAADWLAARLGDGPWLLLLDSLDEVALPRRPQVIDAIHGALDRFPKLRVVVFTRPPVFSSSFGLRQVDVSIELPTLDCARADAAMARMVPDPDRRAALRAVMQRYGLDRKVQAPDGRCYYPHMSTYRDFFVMERIAQNFAAAGAATASTLEPSRASVYTYFLEVLLIKDLQGIALAPRAALLLIDRLLAAEQPGSGDRNIGFRTDACVKAASGANDDERKATCERLLQSSLFERSPRDDGTWKLKNQSLYDLFLARWVDAEIAAATATPCAAVSQRAALLESNEVAGFLVGLPGGQRCLWAVTQQLCRGGGFASHTFEQLDQGLPAGPARAQLVQAALASAREVPAAQLCVTSTLDRLAKGGAKAAPADTPAPPPPQ